MKNPILHLTPTLLALGLFGCATSSIRQSWKLPAYNAGPVRKVAVLAVEERGLVREGLENRFVGAMREHAQDAISTLGMLGLADLKENKEAAAAKVTAAGADTILVIRMVDQATYAREVTIAPAFYPSPTSAYGGYGLYDFYALAFSSMGVMSSSLERKLYLDSSLFDLKTGQRIWSALTRTTLKENADALVVADALAAKVVNAMRQDAMIR
jgi:hypothetical protein